MDLLPRLHWTAARYPVPATMTGRCVTVLAVGLLFTPAALRADEPAGAEAPVRLAQADDDLDTDFGDIFRRLERRLETSAAEPQEHQRPSTQPATRPADDAPATQPAGPDGPGVDIRRLPRDPAGRPAMRPEPREPEARPQPEAPTVSESPSGVFTVRQGRATWLAADRDAAEALAAEGGPEKHATRIVSHQGRVMTLKAEDPMLFEAYLGEKPGYTVRLIDGKLWVFEEGSEALAAIEAGGSPPGDHATRVQAVKGAVRTYKAAEAETLTGYLASTKDHAAMVIDGQLWIFDPASEAYEAAHEGEVPEKHATRIMSLGGKVMTLKSPDADVLSAYVDAVAP